jgi:hypothetical protein
VAKFRPDGGLAWATAFGNSSSAGAGSVSSLGVAVHTDGSLLIDGQFGGTFTIGTITLASAGSCDGFVAKLDASGNALWARRIGGTSCDSNGGVAFGSGGSVFIRGVSEGAVNFGSIPTDGGRDWYVAKLDANGDFTHVRRVPKGATSQYINGGGIATYQDSGTEFVYFAGPYANSANGSQDVFIAKLLATDLTEVWTKPFGSGGYDTIYGPAVDTGGNVYVTGEFEGTGDFDPGPGTTPWMTSSGAYVSKLDAAGTFVWAKRMGGVTGDVGRGIAVDAAGAVYTTGGFTGTAQFPTDTGTATATLSSNRGSNDVFVVKTLQGSPLMAAGGPPTAKHAARLTDAQLPRILAAAIDRWAAAGLDATALAKLRAAHVAIANLGAESLGLAYADSNLIRIDDDAAGHGWYVDPTPWDDAEFATPGDQGEQHGMDLLTVLTHELGHLLGYDHAEDGVMEESLLAGTRQMSAAGWGLASVLVDQLFAAEPTLAALEGWQNRRGV